MSFHDVPQEVADERIEGMRREAEAYRRAAAARRGRRSRAGRRWSLRRQAVALRLSALAHSANELLGEIISPAWPAGDEPRRYIRPTR
jgi:hypothetical protein